MATIKPIEGKSIHQIQSGQVIVDLCSVAKELVENSLDAGATSIDVRFKNHGLDAIEVQDNGNGIAPGDFESIALKHHTSKLSTYDDLSDLQTFGFRGEALSSLCALSDFHIITARASDGPKGNKLDFEISGKLKGTSVIASTKGTTVVVEKIFQNLPVRKRELEKNIKREYGKVLGVLHAYACISTSVKFSVSNQMPKGKKTVVFSTKANPTTRENISNVYGAKTLLALIPLDLNLEMQPSSGPTQSARDWSTQSDSGSKLVHVQGHISRPVVGEGRQTPDRQMFFVNSRPCGLPQVTKAVNEVYRSYNVTQSPFVFANFVMDANAYDVNVSPDKRTIMLHDQTDLLESLKRSLIELFESHDQSVPQSQLQSAKKLPAFRPLSVVQKESSRDADRDPSRGRGNTDADTSRRNTPQPLMDNSFPVIEQHGTPVSLIQRFAGRNSESRVEVETPVPNGRRLSKEKERLVRSLSAGKSGEPDDVPERTTEDLEPDDEDGPQETQERIPRPVADFNARIASQQPKGNGNTTRSLSSSPPPEDEIASVKQTPMKSTPGPIENAFDRMRPKRTPLQTATITIGDTTTVTTIGSTPYKRRRIHTPKNQSAPDARSPLVFNSLRAFAAPGAKFPSSLVTEDEEEAEDVSASEEELSETGEQNSRKKIISSGVLPTSSESLLASSTTFRKDDQLAPVKEVQQELEEDDAVEVGPGEVSDEEYVDENEKKAREEKKIALMIAKAEEAAARPSQDNLKRATKVLKGPTKKHSTIDLLQPFPASLSSVRTGALQLSEAFDTIAKHAPFPGGDSFVGSDPEERLSLTVSKTDFGRMRIVGQFNLGFILAIRPSKDNIGDDLFIVDQHASDEKYNFERLQESTILTPQRLVHPHLLSLTAIEEEIIENHTEALVANGFQIAVDKSDDVPVGNRCSLLTLPTSREVTFTPADLEELLVLLSEQVGSDIPRPAKVRRLLAMRACRGSVMVGKTLTKSQMEKIVVHMGELEKPWNCPHGRPTMRHLYGMGDWVGWHEGDGLSVEEKSSETDWRAFLDDG